ncbi:hypothetical protein EF888_06910 [Silicimonas algicola]|uniref:Uncharacterized protein n=1 Tax=Silicimonas algicola TaxID=1826607 RepID=A0A316G2M6_9RHOB|nr:hypothetical protein [Silicimonas algicola]AZQ66892.1 hypothetical protein EF888_06910 [Silicimonas algicola]PWK55194.1 hypothetical protein C8D95_10873 [Silicimonas algicola]
MSLAIEWIEDSVIAEIVAILIESNSHIINADTLAASLGTRLTRLSLRRAGYVPKEERGLWSHPTACGQTPERLAQDCDDALCELDPEDVLKAYRTLR